MSKQKENNSLENKKTSELLDELHPLTKYDRDYTKEEENMRDDIEEELSFRSPFFKITHPIDDNSLEEDISDFREDIKKLKRHKHDEKNGDVLIRI
jgi:hypothetical protein